MTPEGFEKIRTIWAGVKDSKPKNIAGDWSEARLLCYEYGDFGARQDAGDKAGKAAEGPLIKRQAEDGKVLVLVAPTGEIAERVIGALGQPKFSVLLYPHL